MTSSYRRSNQSTSSTTSPRFVENLRDIYIREGEASSLECRVVGFPRPEVQWERNGRMVPKSRNIQLERIGDRCLLRIKSCQSKDEGHYNCIANNIMGTATSRGTLHVLSGFKDRTRFHNGTKDAPSSEKQNFLEKKDNAFSTNSKHVTKFKTPYSVKSKPDLTRPLKLGDPTAEKDMKAAALVKKNPVPKSKNTNSNRLNSSQKLNCSTGNISHNHIRDVPKKLIIKSDVNKRNQDNTPFDSLKNRDTLRTHLAQSKSPAKLKSDIACRNDRPCIPAKDLKPTSSSKKSNVMKEEQKGTHVGPRRTATENINKDVPEVKKSSGKKEAVKNKPIMRDKNIACDDKRGVQLKLSTYQKSAVLLKVPTKAVKLVRQRKLEDEESLELPSRHVTKLASSACSTKFGNGIEALKVSNISKKTITTNVSPTFSAITNDSCERNKMSDSSLKINSSKKIEAENILRKNRKGESDFKSVKITSGQSDSDIKGDPKSHKLPKRVLGVSNRNVSLKKSSFNSNFRIDCRQTSKLKSNNLNKGNANDFRTNIKQQVTHTTENNLSDFNENSKFGKNDQSDSTTDGTIEKETSYLDPSVGLGIVTEKKGNGIPNCSEHSSELAQDCTLCPCIHKAVFDSILNHEKEDNNGKSKIRSKDVRSKNDKLSYVILASDTDDKFIGSAVTCCETHDFRSTNANGSTWKQNNDFGKAYSALDDMNNLNKNGTSLPCIDLNAQTDLNGLPCDIVQLSKDEKVETYGISRNLDDEILRTTKVPISPRAPFSEHTSTAAGPVYTDDVFHEERFHKPGEKAVELPEKAIREREGNGTPAEINLAVTSLNSLINKAKEDKGSFISGTKTSDGYTKQTDVKDVNYITPQGRRKSEVPDTRTCRGNVRLNSDVIEEECEYFIPKIPEVEAEEDTQQVESQEEFPVRIVKGPQSVTVLRGESVTLAVHFQGTPQPSVVWARGGTTLRSDGRVSILVGRDMSVLTVSDVTADDSGKYVVTVENSGGGDSCFASMAVVGIPEPPGGQPTASDVTDHSLVLSWYGSMYDGGSVVTGYVIEMCTLPERRWNRVSSCVNTSHVIQGLSNGQHYVFRVRAENRYGLSQPSRESEAICLEDSSCEDWELSRGPVKVEVGSLFSEQFELKEEVGKGRFGTVYRCIERNSGRPRAAKIIRCIKAKDKETVHREISVMNKLHHPKLMQILAAFESGKNIIMVMEFISGGELFERVIADDFVLTEHDCVLFMRQICDGVAYMHKCCVLHLDLKPENILCKTKTCHQIKIIDFGLARVYNPDENLRVLFGTPEFVAPEVINYEPVGPSSDMWSVGVICYVLLSGLSPFMGESDPETFANITRGEMDFDDEAFDTISEDAKNFISLLLVKKQKDRMTAEECLKHCWLASPRWNASDIPLSTEKLKRFIIRRKWQKTGTAIRALGRMVSLSHSSLGSSGGTPSPLGSPKIFRSPSGISRSETSESGFSEIFSDTNSVSELIS